MTYAKMATLQFLGAALRDQALAFFCPTHSLKSWAWVLVWLLELCSTEPAVVSSLPLLPLFTSEATVIGLSLALLAEVLSTLVTSNSLHGVVPSSLFRHGFTIVVFHVEVDLAWFD